MHLNDSATSQPMMPGIVARTTDAALVRVAEREDIRRVLTLGRRDFGVYRLARKGAFALLP